MKWIGIAVAVIVLLVVVIAVIGSQLPREHVVSRSVVLQRPPQDVWDAVIKATNTSRVPVDVVESRPPRRLVTRVKDSEKMFGGTWTIDVVPEAGSAARLTITENGWVANPIFRFVSKYVMGHYATIDGVLNQVDASLK